MTARERAIEAGLKAAEDDPRWKFDIYPTGWAEVEDILTIAAPFIESALLDRIEAKAGELDAMAQAQADEFGNYITSAGGSGEYKEGRADAYDDAAELLRSLLTDKEEGNDRV